MPAPSASRFLTAEWRQLAMVNFAVDPAILQPLVPAGTELDAFEGRTYLSMVGFQFLRTKVFGFRFPFHTNFEEVNLRFYVRRQMGGAEAWRRGTVFVRELVPRRIIATIARLIYNEPYLACPMRHAVSETRARYDWHHGGRWQSLAVTGQSGDWRAIDAGSEAEFITEHYWGYTRQRDGRTLEYEVEHPRWRVRAAQDYVFDCDVAGLYGAEFVPFLTGKAASAFLVEGSAVAVRKGQRVV